MANYENRTFGGWDALKAKVIAGKDLLICLFDETGDKLYAVSGQQGLKITRKADTIDITSKDTKGGYKSKIQGMKEWGMDFDGIYGVDDNAHKELTKAFNKAKEIVIKVVNIDTGKPMFGGIAAITDYSLEAGQEDAMTYSIKLDGIGELTDLVGTNITQMFEGFVPKA